MAILVQRWRPPRRVSVQRRVSPCDPGSAGHDLADPPRLEKLPAMEGSRFSPARPASRSARSRLVLWGSPRPVGVRDRVDRYGRLGVVSSVFHGRAPSSKPAMGPRRTGLERPGRRDRAGRVAGASGPARVLGRFWTGHPSVARAHRPSREPVQSRALWASGRWGRDSLTPDMRFTDRKRNQRPSASSSEAWSSKVPTLFASTSASGGAEPLGASRAL